MTLYGKNRNSFCTNVIQRIGKKIQCALTEIYFIKIISMVESKII